MRSRDFKKLVKNLHEEDITSDIFTANKINVRTIKILNSKYRIEYLRRRRF
ncbi:MAG: hypothetical protein ACE5FT_00595 [Candidatus Nanoarchaeia archaeon]